MNANSSANPGEKTVTGQQDKVRSERFELLHHVQAVSEPVMVTLSLFFVVLLFVDYSGIASETRYAPWLGRALWATWVAFFIDFGVRFTIAPDKMRFLRTNWLTAISLALPFLRPIRALRAVRALRSISLVRLIGGINRGMRVLRRIAAGHQFAYVGGLTVIVALGGAVGVWYFDSGVEESPIQSFGDAIWWSTGLVTTINTEKFAVTPEARVIAILLRLFAVSVFGYVTASIASYFIGQQVAGQGQSESGAVERGHQVTVEQQLAALHSEIATLRSLLEARRDDAV